MRAGIFALLLVSSACCASAWGATGLLAKTILDVNGVPVVSGKTIAVWTGESGSYTYIYGSPDPAYAPWSRTQVIPYGGPAGISGDTLLLADSGFQTQTANPARLFTEDGAGNWSQRALLAGNNVTYCDGFGLAAAVDSDTAVVGAPYSGGGPPSPNCGPGAGSVFVFTRDSSGAWSQTQELKPVQPGGNTKIMDFGWRASLSSNTLAVYATEDQTIGNSEFFIGVAYLYTRVAGVWQFERSLSGPDDDRGSALDDDWIAATTLAPSARNFQVKLFDRDGAGAWEGKQTLTMPSGGTGFYGNQVAIGGSLLAVTAAPELQTCIDTCTGPSAPGGLYVYALKGGSWQPLDLYVANPEMQGMLLQDFIATDGATVVGDGVVDWSGGTKQQGIVVLHTGEPTAGYYTQVQADGDPVPQASGGGGFGGEIPLLAGLWLLRRRAH